jgi:hypothetical protein
MKNVISVRQVIEDEKTVSVEDLFTVRMQSAKIDGYSVSTILSIENEDAKPGEIANIVIGPDTIDIFYNN